MPTLAKRMFYACKRAMGQFLALPLAVVLLFVLMAGLVYRADAAWSGAQAPAGLQWLGQMLGDSQSLATLLSTVASSIITVTSITFSLLLIALQQGASALTTQVTDQFLMRRANQFYFGFFVGLSVFVLISLVTASSIHRPVFGTSIAIVLTSAALCMIVVMIYNTIEQMRPRQIVRTIQHHVLRARGKQLPLLQRSRRLPPPGWTVLATLRSEVSGHIVGVNADRLEAALTPLDGVAVNLLVPLGRYLAFGEAIATILAERPGAVDDAELSALRESVSAALSIEDGRDLKADPAYGIGQLSGIAWTAISTAKSNPDPGQAVIESLRDILSRWAVDGEVVGDPASRIVISDAAPEVVMDALENIVLVTSESIQAQTLAIALATVATLLPDVPEPWAARLADVSARGLSSLGEHVLTRELAAALDRLEAALAERGFTRDAAASREATRRLATTIGTLNSRSTRVPSQS